MESTNASTRAVGPVPSQLGDDGSENLVQYANRKLNEAENNYSAFERETLRVKFYCTKLHNFLLSQTIKL